MKTYRLPLLGNKEIVFNTISAENADRYYSALVNSNSNAELEEFIFNLITEEKYADQVGTLEAGVVLSVIFAAFSLSNVIEDIKDFPGFLEEARSKYDTLYSMLYVKICQAMPYKLEELKIKSLNELLELFAMAENVSGKPIDIAKLREALVMAPSKQAASKTHPAAEIPKSTIDSLKKQLDFLQGADIDDDGRYIGDMSML